MKPRSSRPTAAESGGLKVRLLWVHRNEGASDVPLIIIDDGRDLRRLYRQYQRRYREDEDGRLPFLSDYLAVRGVTVLTPTAIDCLDDF